MYLGEDAKVPKSAKKIAKLRELRQSFLNKWVKTSSGAIFMPRRS